MSGFGLPEIFSMAWSFGSSLSGGGSSDGPPPGHPEYNMGMNRSTSALGFIQKGAKAYLDSQDKDAQVFQSAEFQRPRGVKELTRGTAVGQVQMPEIQQRLYQNPEVSRYWEALLNSQNGQLQNLRAATSQEVSPTVRSGRKTKVLSESTLKGEIDV